MRRCPVLLLLAMSLADVPPAAAVALAVTPLPALAPTVPPAPDAAALLAERRAAPLPAATGGTARVVRASRLVPLRQQFLHDVAALPAHGGDRGAVEAIELVDGVHELGALAGRLQRPELVRCEAGRCRLGGPLLVGAGAGLIVAGVELALDAATGALIVAQGRLMVREATVAGGATDGADGPGAAARFRPFLLAGAGGRIEILDSRIRALGYDAPGAYGLTLDATAAEAARGRAPRAVIAGSRLDGLYRGFFSNHAAGVELIGNEIRGSIEYGIDPHDWTQDVLIVGNRITDTALSHGIVLSRGVAQAMIAGNEVTGSGGSGIVLDRRTREVTLIDNVTDGNAGDGIAIYESGPVLIARHRAGGNGRAGLAARNADGVTVLASSFIANGSHGLQLRTGPVPQAAQRAPDEIAPERGSARLMANELARNGAADLEVDGRLAVELLDPDSAASEGFGALPPPLQLGGDPDWVHALSRHWHRGPVRIEADAD